MVSVKNIVNPRHYFCDSSFSYRFATCSFNITEKEERVHYLKVCSE